MSKIIRIGKKLYRRISEREFYRLRDRMNDTAIGLIFTFNGLDGEDIAYFRLIKEGSI